MTAPKKIAYIFFEKGGTITHWPVLHLDHGCSAYPSYISLAHQAVTLKREGYQLVDTDVPILTLVPHAEKYRELTPQERQALSAEIVDLEQRMQK